MIVTWFPMAAAVIVARFHFSVRVDAGLAIAAFIVTAFAVPAMVITWLAFAASDAGVAAFIITAFAVPAVVITRFTLAACDACVSAFVITAFTFAVSAAIIAAAGDGTVFGSVLTNHIVGSAPARHRAIADALMDGPSIHASLVTAQPHPGRSRTAGLTGSIGEQR